MNEIRKKLNIGLKLIVISSIVNGLLIKNIYYIVTYALHYNV